MVYRDETTGQRFRICSQVVEYRDQAHTWKSWTCAALWKGVDVAAVRYFGAKTEVARFDDTGGFGRWCLHDFEGSGWEPSWAVFHWAPREGINPTPCAYTRRPVPGEW